MLKILEWLELYFTRTRTEPTIRHKCDRNGNYYWQVYHPSTNRSIAFNSEQEIKLWLETINKRYP